MPSLNSCPRRRKKIICLMYHLGGAIPASNAASINNIIESGAQGMRPVQPSAYAYPTHDSHNVTETPKQLHHMHRLETSQPYAAAPAVAGGGTTSNSSTAALRQWRRRNSPSTASLQLRSHSQQVTPVAPVTTNISTSHQNHYTVSHSQHVQPPSQLQPSPSQNCNYLPEIQSNQKKCYPNVQNKNPYNTPTDMNAPSNYFPMDPKVQYQHNVRYTEILPRAIPHENTYTKVKNYQQNAFSSTYSHPLPVHHKAVPATLNTQWYQEKVPTYKEINHNDAIRNRSQYANFNSEMGTDGRYQTYTTQMTDSSNSYHHPNFANIPGTNKPGYYQLKMAPKQIASSGYKHGYMQQYNKEECFNYGEYSDSSNRSLPSTYANPPSNSSTDPNWMRCYDANSHMVKQPKMPLYSFGSYTQYLKDMPKSMPHSMYNSYQDPQNHKPPYEGYNYGAISATGYPPKQSVSCNYSETVMTNSIAHPTQIAVQPKYPWDSTPKKVGPNSAPSIEVLDNTLISDKYPFHGINPGGIRIENNNYYANAHISNNYCAYTGPTGYGKPPDGRIQPPYQQPSYSIPSYPAKAGVNYPNYKYASDCRFSDQMHPIDFENHIKINELENLKKDAYLASRAGINLKEFLETWEEGEETEENSALNLPDVVLSNSLVGNKVDLKPPNNPNLKCGDRESQNDQMLYVFEATNISAETVLSDFKHIQPIEKLPDNIKLYDDAPSSTATDINANVATNVTSKIDSSRRTITNNCNAEKDSAAADFAHPKTSFVKKKLPKVDHTTGGEFLPHTQNTETNVMPVNLTGDIITTPAKDISCSFTSTKRITSVIKSPDTTVSDKTISCPVRPSDSTDYCLDHVSSTCSVIKSSANLAVLDTKSYPVSEKTNKTTNATQNSDLTVDNCPPKGIPEAIDEHHESNGIANAHKKPLVSFTHMPDKNRRTGVPLSESDSEDVTSTSTPNNNNTLPSILDPLKLPETTCTVAETGEDTLDNLTSGGKLVSCQEINTYRTMQYSANATHACTPPRERTSVYIRDEYCSPESNIESDLENAIDNPEDLILDLRNVYNAPSITCRSPLLSNVDDIILDLRNDKKRNSIEKNSSEIGSEIFKISTKYHEDDRYPLVDDVKVNTACNEAPLEPVTTISLPQNDSSHFSVTSTSNIDVESAEKTITEHAKRNSPTILPQDTSDNNYETLKEMEIEMEDESVNSESDGGSNLISTNSSTTSTDDSATFDESSQTSSTASDISRNSEPNSLPSSKRETTTEVISESITSGDNDQKSPKYLNTTTNTTPLKRDSSILSPVGNRISDVTCLQKTTYLNSAPTEVENTVTLHESSHNAESTSTHKNTLNSADNTALEVTDDSRATDSIEEVITEMDETLKRNTCREELKFEPPIQTIEPRTTSPTDVLNDIEKKVDIECSDSVESKNKKGNINTVSPFCDLNLETPEQCGDPIKSSTNSREQSPGKDENIKSTETMIKTHHLLEDNIFPTVHKICTDLKEAASVGNLLAKQKGISSLEFTPQKRAITTKEDDGTNQIDDFNNSTNQINENTTKPIQSLPTSEIVSLAESKHYSKIIVAENAIQNFHISVPEKNTNSPRSMNCLVNKIRTADLIEKEEVKTNFKNENLVNELLGPLAHNSICSNLIENETPISNIDGKNKNIASNVDIVTYSSSIDMDTDSNDSTVTKIPDTYCDFDIEVDNNGNVSIFNENEEEQTISEREFPKKGSEFLDSVDEVEPDITNFESENSSSKIQETEISNGEETKNVTKIQKVAANEVATDQIQFSCDGGVDISDTTTLVVQSEGDSKSTEHNSMDLFGSCEFDANYQLDVEEVVIDDTVGETNLDIDISPSFQCTSPDIMLHGLPPETDVDSSVPILEPTDDVFEQETDRIILIISSDTEGEIKLNIDPNIFQLPTLEKEPTVDAPELISVCISDQCHSEEYQLLSTEDVQQQEIPDKNYQQLDSYSPDVFQAEDAEMHDPNLWLYTEEVVRCSKLHKRKIFQRNRYYGYGLRKHLKIVNRRKIRRRLDSVYNRFKNSQPSIDTKSNNCVSSITNDFVSSSEPERTIPIASSSDDTLGSYDVNFNSNISVTELVSQQPSLVDENELVLIKRKRSSSFSDTDNFQNELYFHNNVSKTDLVGKSKRLKRVETSDAEYETDDKNLSLNINDQSKQTIISKLKVSNHPSFSEILENIDTYVVKKKNISKYKIPKIRQENINGGSTSTRNVENNSTHHITVENICVNDEKSQTTYRLNDVNDLPCRMDIHANSKIDEHIADYVPTGFPHLDNHQSATASDGLKIKLKNMANYKHHKRYGDRGEKNHTYQQSDFIKLSDLSKRRRRKKDALKQYNTAKQHDAKEFISIGEETSGRFMMKPKSPSLNVVPKMIIKRSSSESGEHYASMFSDSVLNNTFKWQPIVKLTKDTRIDEMAIKMFKQRKIILKINRVNSIESSSYPSLKCRIKLDSNTKNMLPNNIHYSDGNKD